ncbi:hypothetical protein J7T55_015226 [Diaporthe amygdali]|uniref:uncharacterized protein n=1 Tax=Phomopsis amygdali TaxID=1214568 RepID=UPI0022FF1C30|nr:uncharacterized protein J7T55_015226 [Diaporthe amygdali]KAJ0120497.1 hypothetical protein J7T55_015226 [Diaporthe amygdali]
MSLPIGAVRVIIIVLVFIVLDFIAIGLRIWSRYIQRTPLALNDWTVVLGGIGYHLIDILTEHPEKFVIYLKVSISGQILWAAANTCVKISILSLYTELFPGRKFHIICYGVMLVTVMYLISVICEAFLFCTPVQYNWDKSLAGTCDVPGQSEAYKAAGSINLVIDAIVVGLPMPKLFGLHMLLSRKLSLASMFSLGAIICVISLLRVITVVDWDMNDITYSASDVSVYSVLEPTLGVINICLPTIRPAMLALAGKDPRKGHTVPGDSRGKDASWNSPGKDYGPISKRTGLQGTRDDLPLTNFDRLDDEFPLTTRVEGGPSDTDTTGQHPRQITIQRRWEVKGHHSGPTWDTRQ